MCCAFSGLGHSLRLFCTSNGSAVDYDKIKDLYCLENPFEISTTKRFNIKLLGSLLYSLLTAFKVCTASSIDIVYSRNIISLVFLLFTKSKLFYESHNSPTYFRKKIEGIVFKYNNFAKLVVISNELKKYYRTHYPLLDEDKIVVAHDAASECVVPIETSVNIKRNEIPCLGYTGSLFPGKGIELIVKVARICSTCDFHVVGGSDKEIEGIRMRLKPSVNVIFHGFVDHSKLDAFRTQFDIALLPPGEKVFTNYKGAGDIAKYMSPLKLFEYMSAKLPIICSDLPVLREIIEHEVNGILIQSDDQVLWAEAISELLANPELSKSIAENAFNDFMLKYTWRSRVDLISRDFANV
jgi:glycosyltransferase involved in cell wall biosynthesis